MRNTFAYGLLIAAQIMGGFGAMFPAGTANAIEDGTESPLRITAVQITGGVGKTAEDFIELFNNSSEPFNLNGYRLVKRTATASADTQIKSWAEDTFIPAYSFYLWANAEYAYMPTSPDLTSTATLSDNNGVGIRFGPLDTGELIDSIAWGTANNGFQLVSSINPGPGESLQLADIFEKGSGFVIAASDPRNSTILVQPDIPVPSPTITPTPSVTPEPSPLPSPSPTVMPTVIPTLAPSPSPTPSPVTSPSIVPTPIVSPTPQATPVESSTSIRINEFLPNPTGEDSGKEQVELYNYGNSEVNLSGWVLDDVGSADAPSSNALSLTNVIINAKSYGVVTIPVGKFALNNTNGDVLTLFNSDKQPINSASYSGTAPEGKSYAYYESGWQWASPSFGSVNPPVPSPTSEPDEEDEEEGEETEEPETGPPMPPITLSISEIYAHPATGSSEFIELFNYGSGTVNLQSVTLWVGEKHKTLPGAEVDPGEHIIIAGGQLPAALRNTGQTIKVSTASGTVLDSVAYPKSRKGESYSKFDDKFSWTLQATPGEPNQLIVPEAEKPKPASVIAAKVKAGVNKIKESVTAKLKPKASTTPVNKKSSIAGAATTGAINGPTDPPDDPSSSDSTSNTVARKKPWGVIFTLGSVVTAGSMFVVYKYGYPGNQIGF